MEAMFKEYAFSILRNLATPLIAYLAASGYFSDAEATNLVVAIIAALVAVVWGVLNKTLWKQTTIDALNTTPPATAKKLEEVIEGGD